MDYRKIFFSKNLRLKILSWLKWVPDYVMLPIQYKLQTGKKLNLKNPKRFTEKLQLYKTSYRNDLLPICVDKAEVKNYIASLGLVDIVIPTLGLYEKAEYIDFHNLPEKFVIKTTDGGGGNNIIVCRDKNKLNISETVKKLNSWLNIKNINAGREWAYTGIKKSQIIVEDFLENEIDPKAGIDDYKIFCFNGKPYCIVRDIDRYIGHKRNFYDLNWNNLHIKNDCPGFDDSNIKPPSKLNEMLEVASKLSKPFPFVRVDLYQVKNKIYFGELTFYPWSGYVNFYPEEFDYKLGELFDISSFNK